MGVLDSVVNGVLGTANIGLNLFNMHQQQQQFNDNLRAQEEAQNYNRGLQNIMFAREDTSIQRRTADLKAAGLSPVLAAGQGASSGPVIHTDAPQGERAPIPDVITNVMSLLRMKEDITNTVAQRELIDMQKGLTQTKTAESESNIIKNFAQLPKIQSEVTKNKSASANLLSGAKAHNANADTTLHNLDIYKKTRTTSDSSPVFKDARNLTNQISGVVNELFKGKNVFNMPTNPMKIK